MAIYILRSIGLSREDAALLPRWERATLVEVGRAAHGFSSGEAEPVGVSAHGGFSSDEVAIMMGAA